MTRTVIDEKPISHDGEWRIPLNRIEGANGELLACTSGRCEAIVDTGKCFLSFCRIIKKSGEEDASHPKVWLLTITITELYVYRGLSELQWTLAIFRLLLSSLDM